MTTKAQEFAVLLDELLSWDAVFRRLATLYCSRRGRRGMQAQKDLRIKLDAAFDSLIDIYARCIAAIELIADDELNQIKYQIRFAGDEYVPYEMRLYLRADAIIVAIAPEQAKAIDNVAAQTRWDKARFEGWW